jgi:hypothetical protein
MPWIISRVDLSTKIAMCSRYLLPESLYQKIHYVEEASLSRASALKIRGFSP